ncbi:MAG: hypothetical protein V1836_01825 [Candidatus Aenigmatarchaeota archaeon]
MGAVYENALRPILFRLSGDNAQKLGEINYTLGRPFWNLLGLTDKKYPQLETEIAGIKIDNPIGLAAGYDKSCAFLDSMMALGFGYVVGGTITRYQRKGNPKPWIVRYTKEKSIVNSMGLPGSGAEKAAKNLRRYQTRDKPIIASIAGQNINEWVECLRIIEPLVDGIELNISCPNLEEKRIYQELEGYEELLVNLNRVRKKPLMTKMPRYDLKNQQELEKMMKLVDISEREGVDGLVFANTLPVIEPQVGAGKGGKSGKAIFESTVEMVDYLSGKTKIPLTACGGISSAENILRFGDKARTFQLLTALVYEGPFVVREIKKSLAFPAN